MNYPVNCNENIWAKITRNSSNVLKCEWCWYWLEALCTGVAKEDTEKNHGETQFPKGKWRSFSIPAKAKHCFHCTGRFRNALFCSDLRKNMGTVGISPKKRTPSPANRLHLFSGLCPSLLHPGPRVEPPPLPGPPSVLGPLSSPRSSGDFSQPLCPINSSANEMTAAQCGAGVGSAAATEWSSLSSR